MTSAPATPTDAGTPAPLDEPQRPAVPATAPTPVPDPDGAARTYELDRAHVFHSWSAQAALKPLVVTGGQGSWVWDGAGTPLLDFSGQLVYTNLGLQHPRVIEAIQRQAGL